MIHYLLRAIIRLQGHTKQTQNYIYVNTSSKSEYDLLSERAKIIVSYNLMWLML
jgi:hypothetical protein